MEVKIKHYNELSKDEFHDMIALRIAVFVVEQDCPYQELDGLEGRLSSASHRRYRHYRNYAHAKTWSSIQ